MYALLLVCLVVGFVSLTNAEDSLEVVKENAKFKGNFLYGGRGEKFKLACVAPADLPRKDRSNLIWFEKDRNVCGEKLCEAVEQKYKHSARVIEWTLKEDTVLTCAYIAEPTQWKNVSVHVFADSGFHSDLYEVRPHAAKILLCIVICNYFDWSQRSCRFLPRPRQCASLMWWQLQILLTLMTVLPNNGTLSFAKTYLVDSGVYFCRSTVDKTKRGSIIVVKGKAHIPERNTGSINRLQGDNLEIHCDVYGYPLPTVTWKRDNEDLSK
ncbi:unnamed protein product [Soboliphyme baturini]|uniref:Ig-like domain-containing protein n=1 Tax=Soboliphyme baturini TaxID=241478 RepID=A0A183ICX9_9BILA|nr:unnamed protein product [Soboliphyme baturini]